MLHEPGDVDLDGRKLLLLRVRKTHRGGFQDVLALAGAKHEFVLGVVALVADDLPRRGEVVVIVELGVRPAADRERRQEARLDLRLCRVLNRFLLLAIKRARVVCVESQRDAPLVARPLLHLRELLRIKTKQSLEKRGVQAKFNVNGRFFFFLFRQPKGIWRTEWGVPVRSAAR